MDERGPRFEGDKIVWSGLTRQLIDGDLWVNADELDALLRALRSEPGAEGLRRAAQAFVAMLDGVKVENRETLALIAAVKADGDARRMPAGVLVREQEPHTESCVQTTLTETGHSRCQCPCHALAATPAADSPEVECTLASCAHLPTHAAHGATPAADSRGPEPPPNIKTTAYSPFYRATCVVRCGLWAGFSSSDHSAAIAEAVSHTLDEGHETAVEVEVSTHYALTDPDPAS